MDEGEEKEGGGGEKRELKKGRYVEKRTGGKERLGGGEGMGGRGGKEGGGVGSW